MYRLKIYDHFCEAADSILRQTYDNVEFVVVIDESSSVFDRVATDYSNQDNVVIECNDHNIGQSASRNRGAEVASGDVVASIDDDAIADEAWVERLVRAYEEKTPS